MKRTDNAILRGLVLVGAVVALAGCGSDDEVETPPAPGEDASIASAASDAGDTAEREAHTEGGDERAATAEAVPDEAVEASGATAEETPAEETAAEDTTITTARALRPAVEACDIDSGWMGDEECMLPPDPGEGMQLHFGPSDYDDAEEVGRHVLAPGGEALLCAYLVTPNDEEIYYDDWLNRLRPGSHHMIVTMTSADIEQGSGVPCDQGGGVASEGLVGGNTTSVAPLAEVAPENRGLARVIPAHSGISMQLHFFNFASDEPLLMEAWQNIYYMDPGDVRGLSSPLEGFAGLSMSIQPGTTEVVQGTMVAPQALRVMDLYSHNHDHTLRFSAYLRRQGSKVRTLIYESYDWSDPLFLPLDTIHENPEPDREAQFAGGMTGTLELREGDALDFECEIDNDDLDIPLRFANRAHEGEMCILRGNYEPSFGRAWSEFNR